VATAWDFGKATKLVHCVLLNVYMCADSNMVFRRVEEPIFYHEGEQK
jgi:hypothetical protein